MTQTGGVENNGRGGGEYLVFSGKNGRKLERI